MNFKITMAVLTLIGITVLGILPVFVQQDLQVLAQQQDKIASPPSLKLTTEEINVASPLWNEYQSQQREYIVAISNLRKAAKKPHDKDGHSLAVLALNVVLENADQALSKWNDWLASSQKAHDCNGCEINLQKWEFVKFPTAANTDTK